MLEELGVFCRGILIGLIIAAPVGPIGLLTIRRTLHYGLLIGFATGLGAAFADAIFGGMAAFGVAAILETMKAYSNTIHILGGVFVLYIAYHTWHDKPHSAHPHLPPQIEVRLNNVFKSMAGSFLLTLTNPGTIFGTLAMVATFGSIDSRLEATTIVGGIFGGSALWWLTLSAGIFMLRKKFTEHRVRRLNQITAVLLGGIGIWVAAVGVAGYLK